MKDSKAVIKKFLNDKKNVLLECIVDPKDVVKPE
jgi:acetolactate synthase-1/2/3 large subunit